MRRLPIITVAPRKVEKIVSSTRIWFDARFFGKIPDSNHIKVLVFLCLSCKIKVGILSCERREVELISN